MRPVELLILYLMIGAAVSVAAWRGRHPARWLTPVLWPLVLPNLLGGPATTPAQPAPAPSPPRPMTPDGDRVQAAVSNLLRALDGWDGGAPAVAALDATQRRLLTLADRLRDLDTVLASLDQEPAPIDHPDVADLLAARRSNLEKLRALRDGTRGRLERGIAQLSDLSTRAHLARFTGEEADAVATALTDLAAAVESAGEVARVRT
jgi:hypothetical protein